MTVPDGPGLRGPSAAISMGRAALCRGTEGGYPGGMELAEAERLQALEQAPPDLAEHRREARLPQELEVRLLDSASRALDEEVTVEDISVNGMRLKTRACLEAGRSVGFRLALPRGRGLRGEARVRWSQDARTGRVHGLEIVRMDFVSRERLRRHVAPGRLDWLRAADLILQFSCCVTALLVLRQALGMMPFLRSFLLDSLPFVLILLAPVAGLCMLADKYL